MSTKSYENNCTFISIKDACPICGSRKQRCSMLVKPNGDIVLIRCKYKISSTPSTDGWYLHYSSDISTDVCNNVKKIRIEDYQQRNITETDLELWDKVYRKMRKIFHALNGSLLYTEHKEHLLKRGFTEEELKYIGFWSVPKNVKVKYSGYECKLSTAIITELLKTFSHEELIKVPGLSKITVKDSDYVVLKNTAYNPSTNKFDDIDGFFIPYFDEKHRYVGMQFRLLNEILDEKGKPIRYLWYSSKTVSCGSPIDYFIPSKIVKDDVILISEGALKTKLAASKLGVRSLAEAGVTNYRQLVSQLQKIESIENRKFKVLLSLDMDKYTNNDVISAELNTILLLKSLGYSVTILEWDISEGKGIDDKIIKSIKDFRYIAV